MVNFLVDNPLFTVLLCLGAGYLFGKINLGFFPNNATLGTLYAAILVNIFISSNGGSFDAAQTKVMKTFFFAMFTFVLGYEAGPVFKDSVRKSGIKSCLKLVALSLFYCATVLGCGFLISRGFKFASGRVSGFLAGSQTQSTILNGESDVVAYAITYILATLGMIIFVQKIAPIIVNKSLISSVKEKIGGGDLESIGSAALILPVQIRAYSVNEDSQCCGKTVDELEDEFHGHLQVESIYRNGVEIELHQTQTICAEDIIVVIGEIKDIAIFDDRGLTETTDEKYISFEMVKQEIVVSEKKANDILSAFSDRGVLVNNVVRKGVEYPFSDGIKVERGDIVSVTGRTQAIKDCVKEIGYIKNDGEISDVPFLLLSIALSIPLGLIQFPGTSLSLGTSCVALILGMFVGCEYESLPKFGYISDGARWLLRSVGLNLFIASTALERSLLPSEIFTFQNIYVVIAGLISILIPAIIAILFGRFVLRIAAADLYGGLCGCATSTPALNSLSESTGSTIFTVGYAPAYVTSNICLTIVGSILMGLL